LIREPRGGAPVGLKEAPWWVRLFTVIGLVATVTVILSLFFAFGRRPAALWAELSPEVTSPDFLQAVAGGVSGVVQSGGQAKLLRNGDRFFPAMLEDFASAQSSIHFSVYIWEKGEMSRRISEALAERARAGVTVRVLLDSFGAMTAPDEDLDRMREAGVRVQLFREARLGRLTRFHRRNHRRAIVIDGSIGYTGGAAVADKWMGDARDPKEWRDDMVRVTGALARSLQGAFSDVWTASTGEILVGPGVYPSPPRDEAPGPRATYVSLASAPVDERHPLRVMYGLSFLAARQRLYIASSYFVPDAHTRRFVAERARAGVDVRLLVPNENTDARMIRQATHHYLDELLEAGARAFEYQPSFMHAKYVVVDGQWSIVGSANMDVRSKELNTENVLGILDPGLASELEASFLADLEKSKEIRWEEWKGRNQWKRFQEHCALLFVEQY
jgi:cardiolipin synthase